MTSNTLPQSELFPRNTAVVVRTAAAACIGLGLVALVGWSCRIEWLKSLNPGAIGMLPNTSVLMVLLGVALANAAPDSTRHRRTASRVAALLVIVGSFVTLMQYALDVNFGIDELLFVDTHPVKFHLTRPGRMSPPASVCFILVATAVLLLPYRAQRAIQGLALSTLTIAGLALLGYAYGIKQIYLAEPIVSMAMPTALGLVAAVVGVLYCRDDYQVMAPLRSRHLGGVVARALFPIVVGLPFGVEWLQYQGELHGVFQPATGAVVHAATMILAFGVLVWFCARSLNEADEQRAHARKAEEELRTISRQDPLTGLLNRRRFWERVVEEWERATRYERALSCVMIDLDNFKHVNDTYGHQAGDDVLRSVARVLHCESRPSDLVCRYGGEEFCILLPETNAEEAFHFADRLRRILLETPIELTGQQLHVTGSFGVAQIDGNRDTAEDLLNRADQALLRAKRSGRNQVQSAAEPPLLEAPRIEALSPAAILPEATSSETSLTDKLLAASAN